MSYRGGVYAHRAFVAHHRTNHRAFSHHPMLLLFLLVSSSPSPPPSFGQTSTLATPQANEPSYEPPLQPTVQHNASAQESAANGAAAGGTISSSCGLPSSQPTGAPDWWINGAVAVWRLRLYIAAGVVLLVLLCCCCAICCCLKRCLCPQAPRTSTPSYPYPYPHPRDLNPYPDERLYAQRPGRYVPSWPSWASGAGKLYLDDDGHDGPRRGKSPKSGAGGRGGGPPPGRAPRRDEEAGFEV